MGCGGNDSEQAEETLLERIKQLTEQLANVRQTLASSEAEQTELRFRLDEALARIDLLRRW